MTDAWGSPDRLRCEALIDPLGIDVAAPRLSWAVRAGRRAVRQEAYQIVVASSPVLLDEDRGDLWDSGRVESGQSVHVVYAGTELVSRRECFWKVRCWDDRGELSPWSAPATWEMGLLRPTDWQASWITLPGGDGAPGMRPSAHLRASFVVDGTITRARLFATGLGLYRAYCNGQRVGADHLTPGWTDYEQRVQYQTYDVTQLLRDGENALGTVLGDGWYRGHLGHLGQTDSYGSQTKALVQLEIDYVNGTRQVVGTDRTWLGAYGPILGSDLLMGEVYDARLEMPGWNRPGFDVSQWAPVTVTAAPTGRLVAQLSPTIQAVAHLPAVALSQPRPGTWIFDLGQNLVGWARLKVAGPRGSVVTLRFAEELGPDGTAYTANLGTARCTDRYTLAGTGPEEYEPCFTYRGFRYVEVTGLPYPPALDAVTGVVASSNTRTTGTFLCSNPMVNRLQHNIVWSQRGNHLDIPTDCPQRDERLGWMGDAQMFAATAAFNMDVEAFYAKWMVDVADAQTPDGAFPAVAPRQVQLNPGAPGWGDAGVIVPWAMYRSYGDRRTLERHFDAMVAWVNWIHEANPNLIWRERVGQNFGDWDCLGPETPKDLVATAYFALSARLVGAIALVLGQDELAARHTVLADAVATAFAATFVDENGVVLGDTQTGYALALQFDLVPQALRSTVGRHLHRAIERDDWHVTTGFVGAGLLLPALTEAGYLDDAYRILLQDSYPSWGYEIARGATTIWERWDGWTEHGGFVDPDIGGSFNHFALGAVGEWLYTVVGGIRPGDQPGFRQTVIQPQPGGGLTWAAATLDTPYGQLATQWSLVDERFHLTVTIPANTTARVDVPAPANAMVTESGHPVDDAEGVSPLFRDAGRACFSVGSGTYEFEVSPAG